jgi:phosphate starvation-inducible protein PhoH
MCEYLVTLVTFSRKIIHILHKPTIFQLASPFVAFFDKEAVKFEVELAHWSTAIDRRVMVLLNQRQLDAADTVARIGRSMTKWTTSEGEKRHQLTVRSKELQDKLCSRQSERTAAWRRQRKKGTTHWLFKEKSYQDWKNATKTSIMLIHGKLGSGKTVLLANVVAELYEVLSRWWQETTHHRLLLLQQGLPQLQHIRAYYRKLVPTDYRLP